MTDTIIRDRRGEMPPPRVRRGYYRGFRERDPIARGADTAAARAEYILNGGGWLADMSTALLEDPLTMPVRVVLPPAGKGKSRRGKDAIQSLAGWMLCNLRDTAKYRPGPKIEKGTIKLPCPASIFSQQIKDVDLYSGKILAEEIIQNIAHLVITDLPDHLETFAIEIPQLKLEKIPANEALPRISGGLPEPVFSNGLFPTLLTGTEAWKMLYASARGYLGFPTYGEKVFGVNLHKTSLLPERMVIGSRSLEDGLAAACSPITYKVKDNTVVFATDYAWAVTSPEEFRRYEIIPDAEDS